MVFLYGYCKGNARATAREYAHRYLKRVPPSPATISSAYWRLCESEVLANLTRVIAEGRGRLNVSDNVEFVDSIWRALEKDPTTSIRREAAQQLNVPYKVLGSLESTRTSSVLLFNPATRIIFFLFQIAQSSSHPLLHMLNTLLDNVSRTINITVFNILESSTVSISYSVLVSHLMLFFSLLLNICRIPLPSMAPALPSWVARPKYLCRSSLSQNSSKSFWVCSSHHEHSFPKLERWVERTCVSKTFQILNLVKVVTPDKLQSPRFFQVQSPATAIFAITGYWAVNFTSSLKASFWVSSATSEHAMARVCC